MRSIKLATVRLYEPPLIDATHVSKLTATLTSLSLTGPSSLDLFYRANSALKACFEAFLAVDVSTYQTVPMTACTQFVYAHTMLSRWARLVGPPKPTGLKGTTGVHAAQNKPGVRAETASFRVRGEEPLESATQPSPLANLQMRHSADPNIPAAVAALRQHLQQQEGLALDIGGILKASIAKFEQ